MAFSALCRKAEAASSSQAPEVVVRVAPRPSAKQSLELPQGVTVDVFEEGDGKTFPRERVVAHLVGRLKSGCVFESSEGKGQAAMPLQLGRNAIVPGMEIGLKELSLGALAEIHIPAHLGYGKAGVPRIVPPDSDLSFLVRLLEVDGSSCTTTPGTALPEELEEEDSSEAVTLRHPWWLARVKRPEASAFYLSFCREVARGRTPPLLTDARCLQRKAFTELHSLDVAQLTEPLIVTGMQKGWRAKDEWDFSWFKEHLGHCRQLVKWLGPVFTRQESLWESPVWETSVGEYVDYVRLLEAVDPDCEEQNAGVCPRLYLNGWPAFAQHPWLRDYVKAEDAPLHGGAASTNGAIEDFNSLLLTESEALRESLLEGLTARGSYQAPDKEEQRLKMETEDWELTKLFLSPKGAVTRLHFDNGGAHAWLSQVRGRKMFVCFAPSDGDRLHPFEGDEGLPNGSWLDPLDPAALTRWPDASAATPFMAVVEEGETIVAPQGWWHYAVSLDSSVTIMRNFYSSGNQQELIKRKDGGLAGAIGTHVLKRQAKLKDQPDSVINEIASKTVAKLRETFIQNRPGGAGSVGSGGGYATAK